MFPPAYITFILNGLLQACILVILVAAAVKDARDWEVPLRYTNPLFFLGIVAMLARLVSEGDVYPVLVSAFILWAYSLRWLNAADTKLQIALWGLWPLAGLIGMAVVGLWGLVMTLRKRGDQRFPAVVPLAIGSGLTFVLQYLIIFSVRAGSFLEGFYLLFQLA